MLMMRSRGLSLAVAVFTLAVQVAAAAHIPELHEEPVSQCQEPLSHFCAETVDSHTGPCVLCQVSLNGVFLDTVVSLRTELQSERLVAAVVRPVDFSTLLSSHAPRGPPVA
ncbi:MAG: hypothetical protein EHM91_01130 [Planctomycetota bacterium]|nr:MAG: hypothetical protein EHM91_01130 [Planctomycetota bacterium]